LTHIPFTVLAKSKRSNTPFNLEEKSVRTVFSIFSLNFDCFKK
jgi:hypothetical protein